MLVVVGTGIRTVGQLTVEAIAWIKRADEVIYLVADPVAEDMITSLNPTHHSLLPYYDEGKQRAQSYAEMVDYILSRVRLGRVICSAFYGHPGVFAYPSHESIRRARLEGFSAFMLPAVSAEDCLFADLNVDPSRGGCQSYEATEFLVNAHAIDPSSQLILWQVGVLADWTYRRSGYDLRALPLLTEKLSQFYPQTHEVVLYEAAMLPGCPSNIRRIPLRDLHTAQITAVCTLYIGPCRPPRIDLHYAWRTLYPQIKAGG